MLSSKIHVTVAPCIKSKYDIVSTDFLGTCDSKELNSGHLVLKKTS